MNYRPRAIDEKGFLFEETTCKEISMIFRHAMKYRRSKLASSASFWNFYEKSGIQNFTV